MLPIQDFQEYQIITFSEAGSPVADSFVDTNINTYDFGSPGLDPVEMNSTVFNSAMPVPVEESFLAPAGINALDPADPGFTLDDNAKPTEGVIEYIPDMNIMATLQSKTSPGYPGNATTSNVSNPNNSTSIVDTNSYDFMAPNPSMASYSDSELMGGENLGDSQGMFSKLLSSDAVKIGGITALLASMDGGSEQGVSPPKFTEAQKEYFNRNLATWDWSKIQAAANAKGTSVTEFIINNKFQSEAASGMFDQESNTKVGDVGTGAYVTPQSVASQRYARGGLSAIPGYATGSGDGRADLINARLSDGEYVIDAESVSMLGNGSNKAGAGILNQMRKNLRSHKGKALADGRFSPDAKSPLEYMKRSA